jgi:hypothetical protein
MDKFRHQKKYAERQKTKKNQIQVKVWVPEEHRDTLLSFAKKLRNPRFNPEEAGV